MATCAETLYQASLMRTETRGTNIREDYPERDDKNWLKWINHQERRRENEALDQARLLEKYRYKPLARTK
jgi:succinate dehydrogenase / fumarate reductase flavoprotein subunit